MGKPLGPCVTLPDNVRGYAMKTKSRSRFCLVQPSGKFTFSSDIAGKVAAMTESELDAVGETTLNDILG